MVLWPEAATGLLQTFPYLGLVPLITVQLNDRGNEEEEEFHLLLMGSYFNIKSLPEHCCELGSQIAYQHLRGVSWVDSYVCGDVTSSFTPAITAFYECLEQRLLRSSQAAMWKKFRFMWRIAASGLDSKTEHFGLQFRAWLLLLPYFSLQVTIIFTSPQFFVLCYQIKGLKLLAGDISAEGSCLSYFSLFCSPTLKDYCPSPCTLFERQRHQLLI